MVGYILNKPEWIVFDVGGVLLDWRSSSENLAHLIGVDTQKLLDAVFEVAPMMNTGELDPTEGWTKILAKFNSRISPEEAISFWRQNNFWISDSLELVRDLREAGFKLAILTNSWLGLTNSQAQESLPEELELFTTIIDSSSVGVVKPSKEAFKLATSALKAETKNILLIDDSADNLTAAKDFGWQAFYFNPNTPKRNCTLLRNVLIKQ